MAVRFYDEMLNWHGERSPHAAEPAPAALVQQGEVRSHYGRFAEGLGRAGEISEGTGLHRCDS